MHAYDPHRAGFSEKKKKNPLSFIIVFVAVVLLVTVIIGNLLPLLLSDAALNALQGGSEDGEGTKVESTVKKLHAYAFPLGGDTSNVWETPQVSVSINAPSGKLTYSSDAAKHLGYSSYRTPALYESMEELDEAASYISGVFYPYAPYLADEDLRDAEAYREVALMREFLRAGGDEILIRSLPFGEEGIELSDLCAYVESVSNALGDSPVVVAVPLSALTSTKTAHRLLSRLSEVCDRLSIDLGAADGSLSPEQWLAECDYYITQYEMRILLSETQTDLLAATDKYTDVQTFTRIPDAQINRAE